MNTLAGTILNGQNLLIIIEIVNIIGIFDFQNRRGASLICIERINLIFELDKYISLDIIGLVGLFSF
jgi:hypothetical protein